MDLEDILPLGLFSPEPLGEFPVVHPTECFEPYAFLLFCYVMPSGLHILNADAALRSIQSPSIGIRIIG